MPTVPLDATNGLASAQFIRPCVSHSPVPELQDWPDGQLTGVPPHEPPPQASAVVHGLPSLHAFVLLECVQPLPGLHPSVVQPLPSSQLGAGPPTQMPPEQASFVVHALPSLQGSVLFVWLQVPAEHVSVVQTLLSLQSASTVQVGAGGV